MSGMVAALRARWLDPAQPGLLVVAHRGAWAEWDGARLREVVPENSLPAIERAAALGVPVVELDLKRTRDGHLVVLHDAALDRTTTASGAVASLSLAEVRQARLRCDGQPTSHRVPTLAEAMEAARGRVLVNLDHATRSRTRVALEELSRLGLAGHAIFKGEAALEVLRATGEAEALPMVHLQVDRLPEVTAQDLPGELEAAIALSGACAIELSGLGEADPLDALGSASVGAVRASGARLWINTLGASQCAGCDDLAALASPDRAGWRRLREAGASILQTDAPAELLAWLGQSSLRTG